MLWVVVFDLVDSIIGKDKDRLFSFSKLPREQNLILHHHMQIKTIKMRGHRLEVKELSRYAR